MLGRPKHTAVESIALDEIYPSPDQTRAPLPPEDIEPLARSIAAGGLINPVTLRKRAQGGYFLIAGHRRAAACRSIGRTHIEAIILEKDEASAAVVTVIENLQRRNLGCFEEARGIGRLMELWGMSQSRVCGMLGLSQSALSNKLRLLKLPMTVQQTAQEAALGERICRALLRLPEEGMQLRAVEHISAKALGAAEAERYIEGLLTSRKKSKRTGAVLRDYRLLFTTMDNAVREIRRSGISVTASRSIEEDCVLYTVRVPKDIKTGDSPQLSLY